MLFLAAFKSNHQKRDQSTLATSASTLNIALVVELCAIYLDLVSAATLLGKLCLLFTLLFFHPQRSGVELLERLFTLFGERLLNLNCLSL